MAELQSRPAGCPAGPLPDSAWDHSGHDGTEPALFWAAEGGEGHNLGSHWTVLQSWVGHFLTAGPWARCLPSSDLVIRSEKRRSQT